MKMSLSRRSLLASGTALGALSLLPVTALRAAGEDVVSVRLNPQPGTTRFFGPDGPKTPVWGYGGAVPGPEIRVRQGGRVRLELVNGLDQPTSVHPHGIRLPNAQDGAPPLTQAAVQPGGTFVQEFAVQDAGTHWYHPHVQSSEQLGRGLSGILVVEERDPPPVDRDMAWLLDDWRLGEGGVVDGAFAQMHDMAHAGRWGNVVTINGKAGHWDTVQAGERLRLRLVNGANARIFALTVQGAEGWVMAVDGHPLAAPRSLDADAPELLGPGMRADLFLDITAEGRVGIIDVGGREPQPLAVLTAEGRAPKGHAGTGTPPPLPPNPVAERKATPDVRESFTFTGGAMGRMSGAMLDGTFLDMRTLAGHGLVWAINGVVPMTSEHDMSPKPLLEVARGQTVRLELVNDTAWPHPIHLHGHSFHVVSRGGQPVAQPELRDTVLLLRGESAEIEFVADNPGDWMFHCHVLEHQASGMMGFLRVT